MKAVNKLDKELETIIIDEKLVPSVIDIKIWKMMQMIYIELNERGCIFLKMELPSYQEVK